MQGYTAIEQGVINQLLTTFSTELDADRCKAGDIDAVLLSVFEEGNTYGCILEYFDGKPDTREPYNKNHWIWVIGGMFIIRYSETVEADLRNVIDKLATRWSDQTLGNVSPRARVIRIGKPEPETIADVPFYWLPFVVEALDRD